MSKIDVIIPTYNRATLLERAVASVVAQTYPDWQLWIVDDGSTDETAKVIEKWQTEDSRIKGLRCDNRGVSFARNMAMAQSLAPLIAFLDSDDAWLPEKLKLQAEFMAAHPEIPLVHSEEIWIRNGRRVNPMNKHKKSGGRIFKKCLPLCCISPSATMLRRTLINEVGPFRQDFVVCEDYELWLRITSRYEVGFLSEPLLVKYGGHEDQLSRRYHSMDEYRLQALSEIKDSPWLTEDERLAVEQMIAQKASILLRGCRKHENLSNYDRLFRETFL